MLYCIYEYQVYLFTDEFTKNTSPNIISTHLHHSHFNSKKQANIFYTIKVTILKLIVKVDKKFNQLKTLVARDYHTPYLRCVGQSQVKGHVKVKGLCVTKKVTSQLLINRKRGQI